LGNVTSEGNIKTKPDNWADSIKGTASAYTTITDATCLTNLGFCNSDDYHMRKKSRVLNKKIIKVAAAPNIHVENGETYNWWPGTYGKVSFGYQSNITIHSGAYNVNHLEIKTEVTFIFADISGACDSAQVLFNASRTIDIEADFNMVGVQFGNPFTGCTGTYGVLWGSDGDISIKQTPYPLFGAFVAGQKVNIERENTVNGCIAGFTGVHVKTRVNLNSYGSVGCTCNQLFNNTIYFTGCDSGPFLNSTSTFDFTTLNSIALNQFNSYGDCSGGGCAYSISVCLGGDTATCVADNLPYTTIISGTTSNDNVCSQYVYFPLSPGTYSMSVFFDGDLIVGPGPYNFPNAGITIAASAAGTGDVPSDSLIGFQAAFQSSDAACGSK